MADGHAVLEQQLARLRALGKLVEDAAPKVAQALEREITANVKRAVGPDGTPWPPTEDGHKPLQGIARDLSIRAVGTAIVSRVVGIGARHHLGAVRGGKRRPILPSGKIPDPMTRAIERVVEDEFKRTMEGGDS